MENMKQTRNHYVDFLRGVAMINIVFIHTVFWSGSSYIPAIMRSLSLILDVPFFFFLSGLISSNKIVLAKTLHQMLAVYKKYTFFLLFYFGILIVIGLGIGRWDGVTASNLYQSFFFMCSKNTLLPGVYYSSWFLPTYFAVIPIGSLLLWLVQNSAEDKQQRNHTLREIFAVVFLGLLYTWVSGKTFAFLSTTTLFYLIFFLLGVFCKNYKIEHLRTAVILLTLDVCLIKGFGRYFGWDISASMQAMKFPPNVVWLLYSLIMIIIALWVRGIPVGEENPFCKIGRNSLWFYFCQGISGSALYYIAPRVTWPWYFKLPVMYAINLALAIVLVFVVERLWIGADKLQKHLSASWFQYWNQ